MNTRALQLRNPLALESWITTRSPIRHRGHETDDFQSKMPVEDMKEAAAFHLFNSSMRILTPKS